VLCKRFRHLIEGAKAAGVIRADRTDGSFFEAGGGCNACNRSGFSGRTGIFEFRDMRSQIADQLVRQRARFDSAAAESVFSSAVVEGDIGSRTMREDGVLKAYLGITTPEEVFGATMDSRSEH
jgi:type II secretory ATPase GspE/PulE/Tfp pilus assembly ATPase PilB-like protein